MGIERIGRVREALCLDPQFPVVTVGGTNGKGSVCGFLDAVLGQAGYTVGLYTSPHLLVANERIRVGGVKVTDEELCSAFAQVEMGRGQVPLTYFEYFTLAAMVLFVRRKVDVAVLEVGMGGRLDAVNVFDPDVAVIASIDLDHAEFLGTDRRSVAAEKAGIFRPGRPAVCGDPCPPDTLVDRAKELGTRLLRVGRDFSWVERPSGWDFWSTDQSWLALPGPGMTGTFQFGNASTALAALALLRHMLPVSAAAVDRGLCNAFVPGRFQVVDRSPDVILDVAHNPHGARALAASLRALPCTGPTLAVFGAKSNKDIAGVVEAMAGEVSAWFLCDLESPQAARADQLSKVLAEVGVRRDVHRFDSAEAAYKAALESAGGQGRIVVFGSFVTVATVLQTRGRYNSEVFGPAAGLR